MSSVIFCVNFTSKLRRYPYKRKKIIPLKQSLSMQSISQTLQQHFGFSKFRPNQEKIIRSILEGKDVMALMPTGGGKSLCYQLPALVQEGLTVVISPLIALMKDQVDALKLANIPAAYLNSTISPSEQQEITKQINQGTLKLLYLSPERLFGNEHAFLNFLKTKNISLFAIDEAHCISQWGHDFRPEYRQLNQLKSQFSKTPILALTATADEITQKDILERLQFPDPQVFISSFNRPNIHYYVHSKKNYYEDIIEYLKEHPNDSGIIYTLSRKSTERLSADLREDGFSALPYHAGLPRKTRDHNQEVFLRDDVNIIVATIAFGMGIDKSNVRFVMHADLPKNIEGYYQETGRAGRDGLKSDAILFFGWGDVQKLKYFTKLEDNPEQTKVLEDKLDQMVRFSTTRTCRRKFLLNYFNEETEPTCGSCDVCLSTHEKWDATIPSQKLLSAVVRLKEGFGMNYVIDFLRGSKSEKIREWHKDLKTYGVGKDISKEDWKDYSRQLIDQKYLKQEGEFPVLQLTDRSMEVLHGKEKVYLFEADKTTISHTENQIDNSLELDREEALFQKLRQVRKQIADEENVPAFVIFSDATLTELSQYFPQNKEDLERIAGFGEVKIEKYGEVFLKVILSYCEENQLESRIDEKKIKPKRKKRKPKTSNSKKESFRLFQEGKSIEEIAEIRGYVPTTIESHLAYFVEKGALEVNKLVDPEKIPTLEKAIKEHFEGQLKPVKEALGDDYSYGEIRIALSGLKFKDS